MVYELICEGACNPNIHLVDRLAEQYMSERSLINGGKRSDDLIQLQRKLVYTPHIVDDDTRYCVCGLCGTRRRY